MVTTKDNAKTKINHRVIQLTGLQKHHTILQYSNTTNKIANKLTLLVFKERKGTRYLKASNTILIFEIKYKIKQNTHSWETCEGRYTNNIMQRKR